MSIKTGVVETAAIKAGYCVKKGSAEKGVVIATANADCLGVSKGNVNQEESFAVGEHLSFAMIGEVTLAVLGTTVTAGQFVGADSAGKIAVMGVSTQAKRVGIALANGYPGEAVEIVVTTDEVVIP